MCEGDGDRLVGMLTDRDIAMRVIAAGKAPQSAHVDEVMSHDVRWCFEDQPRDADTDRGRVEQVVQQVSLPDGGADTVPGEVQADAQAGARAAGRNANGVLEALTGIDQCTGGRRLEEVGVTGQPRIDNSGELLHNAGSHDPADNASRQADVDGRKPPSKPGNAV